MLAEGIFTIIIYLFGLGAGLPMGVAPAPEDPVMADVAPEECLFYATWTGVEKGKPGDNPTEQWWGQPEIQKMVNKLIKAHRGQVMQEAKLTQNPLTIAFADLLLQLSEISLEHPFAFYVENAEGGEATPLIVNGAAILGLGDETDAIEKAIEKIDALLKHTKDAEIKKLTIDGQVFHQITAPEKNFGVTFGLHGKYFLIGFGKGSGKDSLERLGANSVTGPPKWLTQIRNELPVKRFSSLSYINTRSFVDVMKTDPFNMFHGHADDFFRGLDRLVGDDLKSIASVSGLDDDGYLCRTSIRTDKELTGLLKIIDGNPITEEMIEKIPADPMVSIATRLSTTRTLELISDFAEDVGEGDRWEESLEQLQEMTGMRLKEEILEALDDYFYFYETPKIENPFMPNPFQGWIASIRIKDEMSFPTTLEAINEVIRNQIEESDDPVDFHQKEIDGFDFCWISLGEHFFGPMQVAWTLADKELIIGSDPQAILKHLEGPAVENQMLKTKTVQQFLQHGKGEGVRGPIALTSFDMPVFLKMIWPFIQMFGKGDEPFVYGFDFSFNDIPRRDVLTKQVEPNRTAIYRTEQGFEMLQRQTFPSSSPGVTAVAFGLLAMPHAADDIVKSVPTTSKTNALQLSLSILCFEGKHERLPASHTENKAGKRLLSWRVHVLPFLEEKELYEQFHLDEPWDSPHNKKLIEKMPDVFKDPTTDLPPGMTVYLAVTGEHGVLAGPVKRADNGKEVVGKHGLEDITDGLSNTIMLIAVNPESAVPWTQPTDLSTDAQEVLEKTRRDQSAASWPSWYTLGCL